MFLAIAILALPCSAVAQRVTVGAKNLLQLPLFQDAEQVALVVNHTSLVDGEHLVDMLQRKGISSVVKLFSPEHGFRGQAGAGEEVASQVDSVTGLPVVSLYGAKRKPDPEDLEGIDLVVFDMQDVGTRFYTYLSTMALVMDRCAELGIPFLVLDRPNPNGGWVDGPIRHDSLASFVAMHPIPVLHGMTLGELAHMIVGEGWLSSQQPLQLHVLPAQGYAHGMPYSLPVRPSPNLPNDLSVTLYPTLCFFEGTTFSVGRGTEAPFQMVGHPLFPLGDWCFTPVSTPGAALHPKHEGKECRGYRFTEAFQHGIELELILSVYQNFPKKEEFFTEYFKKLAGTVLLQEQIAQGLSAEEIRASWEPELAAFRQLRSNYLMYPDQWPAN